MSSMHLDTQKNIRLINYIGISVIALLTFSIVFALSPIVVTKWAIDKYWRKIPNA